MALISLPGSAFSKPRQVNPKFGGINEFATAVGKSPEDVSKLLPQLFAGLDLSALVQNLTGKDRVDFVNNVNATNAGVKASNPVGTVEHKDGKYIITSYDNDEGKAAITEIAEAQRTLVAGPETDMKTFLSKALGDTPRIIISPVGWTVPTPDVMIRNNKAFKDMADLLKASLVEKYGESHPELDKKYQKGLKKLAGEAYEQAFQRFWEPIDKYLFEDRKLDPKRFAFLTSASYAGIDKAAMDFADRKGISVVNVTPYCYAQWMDTSRSDALLVTKTVDDYAKACSEGANLLLVTGGRAHTWEKDVKNFLIEQNKAIIPVDVLKEFAGFDVPAMADGKVDNAARLLLDRGLETGSASFTQNVRHSDHLTESQRKIAGAIETLYNQLTFADPKKIAASL